MNGGYDPPATVVCQSRERVDEATREHLCYMFRAFEDGIALGSHDPDLVTLAADLHATHGTPHEGQTLMRVRTGAQGDLAAHHDVWQYAPLRRPVALVSYRRLRTSARSARFVIRAVAPG